MTLSAAARAVSASRAHVLSSMVAVAVVLLPLIASTVGLDERRPSAAMAPAQAWLVTSGSGALALVDGPSATFVASAPFGQADSDLVLAQNGLTVHGVDRRHGGLRLLAGATRSESETSVIVDAATTPITSGGRTYLHRPGRLELLNEAGTAVQQTLPVPAGAKVAATGSKPAFLDAAAGTVTWLDRSGPARLQETVANDVLVAGDEETGDVYLLDPASRALTACQARTATCAPHAWSGSGGSLGQPVVAAGRLVVPLRDERTVQIVNLRDGAETVSDLLFDTSTEFELVVVQGYVFANPRNGNTAAVIAPDDGVRSVRKYSTARPDPSANPPTPPPTASPTLPPLVTPSPTRPSTATPTLEVTTIPPTRTSPTGRPTSKKPTNVPSTTKKPTKKPTKTASPTPTKPKIPKSEYVEISAQSGNPVSVTATVNVLPEKGQKYYLILKLVEPDAADRYFGRARLDSELGQQSLDLAFPEDSDENSKRTLFVVMLTPDKAAQFQAQIDAGLENELEVFDPPCCKVSNSESISIG